VFASGASTEATSDERSSDERSSIAPILPESARAVNSRLFFDAFTSLFGCANPPSDYASGQDLFADRHWDWLIAASYSPFALVEPDRMTIVYPASYEIRDRNYRLVPNPTLPRDRVRAALHEMRRFYR
jgi:membrane-anchored protein YejM (alkaline phosphatase superfamily)